MVAGAGEAEVVVAPPALALDPLDTITVEPAMAIAMGTGAVPLQAAISDGLQESYSAASFAVFSM